jgi:2-C-methyl-D-erythritol 4-phosphate cytidylyltransferase
VTSAVGVVPTVGRALLSGLNLCGEPLFVHAARRLAGIPEMRTFLVADDSARDAASAALARAQVAAVEVVGLLGIQLHLRALAGDGVVVVHDPLCPLTPAAWVSSLLDRSRPGLVVAAVQPVVDTLKTTRAGVVTGTLDRAGLHILSSPTMVPAGAMIDEPGLIELLADPVALVELLLVRYDVELVEAPSMARRVHDQAGVELLAETLAHRQS